ncbi:MAG TPA: hypothetical protein VHQ64_07260 [Pyrinomonadaceae bacterium]|nr:hypothetical protein [Pyrinomonadaceae bacterium]
MPDWAVYSLLALLAYLPYAEVLHDIFHYQILGFAAEVTVVPTVAIFVIFTMIAMFRKPILFVQALLFFALMAVVLFARYQWRLDLTINDTLRQAVGLRYLILVPVYVLVAGYALQRASARTLATNIIIANGVIAALVALLYVIGLISYRIVPEGSEAEMLYATGGGGRASGLSAGINVFSSFLLLALIVAALVYQRSAIIRIGAISMLLIGIMASQSRWPMISSIVVLGASVFMYERSGNKKRLLLVVFGVVLALAIAYASTESTSSLVGGMRGRMSEGMGDDIGLRQSKYEIGLNAIFESTYTALAGATPETLIQGYRQEYIFSDNGVLSMFISAGIPITLAFIFFCFRFGQKFAPRNRTFRMYVFGVLAFGVMFFNNAIYWDSWLIHAAITCFLIADSQITPEGETGSTSEEQTTPRHDVAGLQPSNTA